MFSLKRERRKEIGNLYGIYIYIERKRNTEEGWKFKGIETGGYLSDRKGCKEVIRLKGYKSKRQRFRGGGTSLSANLSVIHGNNYFHS